MKRVAIPFVLAASVLLAGRAHADMPVVDAAGDTFLGIQIGNSAKEVAHQIQQLANDTVKIAHLVETVNALRSGNIFAAGALISELNGLGLTSPLGDDAQGLASALQGLGTASLSLGAAGVQLSQAVQNTLNSNTVFLPSGITWRDAILAANAAAAAAQTATAQQSLTSSNTRLQRLQALQTAGGSSSNVTDAANFAGRAGIETAIGVAQGNQLLGVLATQAARTATTSSQDEQIQRCQYARLAANAASAKATAAAGTVQLVTTTSTISCGTSTSTSSTSVGSGSSLSYGLDNGSADTTGSSGAAAGSSSGSSSTATTAGGSTALNTMLATSWGQTAADNATALGVNPSAVAATCVLESNCSAAVGGSGTISGAFQMSNGTYAQTVSEVTASNPDLASQITSKNDPASQSIAASQYLSDAATSLQNAGIANPTILDARSYYQFGPTYGAAVAQAPGDQLMATVLSGTSQTTLANNNITSTTTVSQWRASVASKIGDAATQPVLLGSSN